MMRRAISSVLAGFALVFAPVLAPLHAQVTSQRLEKAASEPRNWMVYGGNYANQRYSGLHQINRNNAKKMEQIWVVQDQVPGAWESNPLVVDGIMYVTQRPNDVMALDART